MEVAGGATAAVWLTGAETRRARTATLMYVGRFSSCCPASFMFALLTCSDFQEVTSLFSAEDFAPVDPTQEVIFPPELMVKHMFHRGGVFF